MRVEVVVRRPEDPPELDELDEAIDLYRMMMAKMFQVPDFTKDVLPVELKKLLA